MSDLLTEVINELDYNTEELYDASHLPNSQNKRQWLGKGDWLKSSAQADVSKVFFVQNNPIVVFAKCGNTPQDKIQAFNKIWCLSGPRILFLESVGELSVIDLAQEPIRITGGTGEREFNVLEKLTLTSNILQRLQNFHRMNIESGKVFQDERFGDINNRADHSLISDLRTVRRQLIEAGLSESCTHSLIGRSIFIRYLEDRGIITNAYYLKIAKANGAWCKLIKEPAPEETVDFSYIQSKYSRVLQDKDFTYALFRQLSKDFNGDMFPNIDIEERNVKEKHLKLLRNMLYGNTYNNLFFLFV